MHTWDAIVIGAGAAGLSAAQMLGRSLRRTLVVDAGSPRNRFAAHMHGVLGHDGAAPSDLMARGREELERYGVAWRGASVVRVDEESTHVSLTLEDQTIHHARAVIVATGISDDLPPIRGLAERWGEGVLHCPYCHGWEVRGRRLGVLLVSPLQAHQAQLVRQWSEDVVVFAHTPLDPVIAQRLRARAVEIITEPVVEVFGEGRTVSGVRLGDGSTVPVGALFTMGAARPHDGFLSHLDLPRSETPLGSFLEVDATGRTGSTRIWAAGNVVSPAANIPLAMGAGAMAGASVNSALVEEDVTLTPAVYWEQRYADRVWSGRPNATLVDIVAGLSGIAGTAPGRALDLGCGEGADVIWLAEQGWDATGLDISPGAIHRARTATHHVDGRARFDVADLSTWDAREQYDLITASFFQSPVDLDRRAILRRAADAVAPGGRLLVISHAAPPPWASPAHTGHHVFLTPDEELAGLDLGDEWTTEIAETRRRTATAPDGTPSTLDDTVVLVRRRGSR